MTMTELTLLYSSFALVTCGLLVQAALTGA
jgi:hypothetical protein